MDIGKTFNFNIKSKTRLYFVPVRELCNASCTFCYMKEKIPGFKKPPFINFEIVKSVKNKLGKTFQEVEITGGGDPTIHKDIDKIYLSSPVLDFNKHNIEGDEQELKNLTKFVKRAYKNIFRFDFDDISERMTQFEEFSQKGYIDKISKPILISHDPNDKTVSIKHAKNLIKLKPEIKLIEHSFGHSNGLLPKIWDRIGKFLNESKGKSS